MYQTCEITSCSWWHMESLIVNPFACIQKCWHSTTENKNEEGVKM